MARRDDDALSWGDDDPTLDVGDDGVEWDDEPAQDAALTGSAATVPGADPAPRPLGVDAPAPDIDAPVATPGRTRPGIVTAQVTGPDGVTRTREVVHPYTDDRKLPRRMRGTTEAADAPLGNVALVSLGVLGGVYLLFALGWFLSGSRFQVWGLLFLEPAGYIAAWALATAAPVAWFVAVLVLTARRPVWQRILPLLLGVLVLVPWPFLMTGVVAV
jgi:hypothetical protein